MVTYLDKTKFDSGIPKDWMSYDFGYGYAIAGGVRVFRDVRWELEVSGRESTVKHDSAGTTPVGATENPSQTTAFMTNVYYDLRNRSAITPYVGAGVGDAYVRNARFYTSGGQASGHLSAWTLAYQFMAGISYDLTDTVGLNLGYRYFTGPDVRVDEPLIGTTVTFRNSSHNAEAGIRWFFD